MKIVKSLIIIGIIVYASSCYSQVETQAPIADTTVDTAADETYNETKFSVQTGNNIVQVGQAMDSNEIYIRPAITFYHKTGIYVGGNLTFMPSDNQRIVDNFFLNIGYDRELNKVLSAGIDYSYSYYYSTKQIASSVGHMIRPYITWDNKYVSPTLTPMILLGSTTDYALQLDLTHVFLFKSIFTKRDRLSIPISIGAIGGTSDYYTTYAVKRKGSKRPVMATATMTEVALTSLYSMITVKYRLGRTSLSMNTSYYHSTDPNDLSTSGNTPVYKLTLAYTL